MALPIEAAGGRGGAKPSIARVRDYWLGGRHHREVDRHFAENTAMCAPHIPYLVRAQRALLGRMVRYLVEQGVRQFLDLGSGVPTLGHVHEIAQALDPAARVVYVDHDPGVAADGRYLLEGNDNAVLIDADLRNPDEVLAHPQTRRLLDLSEPLAVLVIATLQHIPDSEKPCVAIAGYREVLSPGSYLAMSHYGTDTQLVTAYTLFDQMKLGSRPEVNLRDRNAIDCYFDGLTLVEPGIVPILLWRPDSDEELGRNADVAPIWAAMGRKP
jgi:hypothetical protein